MTNYPHNPNNTMRNAAFVAIIVLVLNALITWATLLVFISYYMGGTG